MRPIQQRRIRSRRPQPSPSKQPTQGRSWFIAKRKATQLSKQSIIKLNQLIDKLDTTTHNIHNTLAVPKSNRSNRKLMLLSKVAQHIINDIQSITSGSFVFTNTARRITKAINRSSRLINNHTNQPISNPIIQPNSQLSMVLDESPQAIIVSGVVQSRKFKNANLGYITRYNGDVPMWAVAKPRRSSSIEHKAAYYLNTRFERARSAAMAAYHANH
jgi:hypothetical protein